MTDDHKISVLMSVYNDERYLENSIESILSQTHKNFCFIIIDDASSDSSPEILQKYSKLDARISVYRNEKNEGLAYSLNKGLELINTEFVARMDADDIAIVNRLEIQLDYLLKHPTVDILGGFALDINGNNEVTKKRMLPITHQDIKRIIWSNPIIHPTVMYKRSKIIEIGSYNSKLKRRQDYELWFRAIKHGLIIENYPTPLIYYRFTDDYYKKNSFKSQINQFKIGFWGCLSVKANLVSYLALMVPLVRSCLPMFAIKYYEKLMYKFDPRKKWKI